MPSIDEATAAEVAATRKDVSAAVLPPPPAPRPGRTHTFQLDVYTGDGHMTGSFTTRVLSIADQMAVGRLRAKMLASLAVDDQTTFLAEMLAHLQLALVERPDWAKDLLGLDDAATVEAIYREVAAHEANFRRARAAGGGGA